MSKSKINRNNTDTIHLTVWVPYAGLSACQVTSFSKSKSVSFPDRSVLVVWYGDVLVVVAAVVGRVEELGGLRGQARAQGFVAAQHRRQVLGLLGQLLHLLAQGGVLLLQVLTLLEGGKCKKKGFKCGINDNSQRLEPNLPLAATCYRHLQRLNLTETLAIPCFRAFLGMTFVV